jgi:HAD superfamily hydrolase (TIGR01509 family)
MSIAALIFDVDGTLADTEELHRQAFNAAFRAHGLDWNWGRPYYGALLHTTGGKERICRHIDALQETAARKEELRRLVPELHRSKTRLYVDIVARQAKLRTGVERLLRAAREAGLRLALASTTTPANVEVLLGATLGGDWPQWFEAMVLGDQVPNKKPAPDVYLKVLSLLGLPASRCVAFEDSAHGLAAARAAGLYTVVTPTFWTLNQDFSAAQLFLPSFGDPEHHLPEQGRRGLRVPYLDLQDLQRLHGEWQSGMGRPGTAIVVPIPVA